MKTILTLLLAACTSGMMLAQDIKTFSITNGTVLTPSYILRGDKTVETIVGSDFDLTNVNTDYTLSSATAFILEGMPTDFSVTNPQTVTVSFTSGTSKDWLVYVKKINPASLPFPLSFSSENPTSGWTPATVGWAVAVGNTITNTYPEYIRLAAANTSFVIGFNGTPTNMTYELYTTDIMGYSGELKVEESANGTTWDNIKTYSSTNPLPLQAAMTPVTVPLKSTTKYVRWLCAIAGSPSILNNITVNGSGSGIESAKADVGDIVYQPSPGEIAFKQPVSKVEVYNTVGTLIAVYNNPGSSLFINDNTKGIAIMRVTLPDGTVVSCKVVK